MPTLITPVAPTASSTAPTADATADAPATGNGSFAHALSKAGSAQTSTSGAQTAGKAPGTQTQGTQTASSQKTGADASTSAGKTAQAANPSGAQQQQQQAGSSDAEAVAAAAAANASGKTLPPAGMTVGTADGGEGKDGKTHDASSSDAATNAAAAWSGLPAAALQAIAAERHQAPATPAAAQNGQATQPHLTLPGTADAAARGTDAGDGAKSDVTRSSVQAAAFQKALSAAQDGANATGQQTAAPTRVATSAPSQMVDLTLRATSDGSGSRQAASVDGTNGTTPGAATTQMAATTQATAVQTGTTHAGTVQPQVGTGAWGQAMSQQVLLAAQGQHQYATLQLNPQNLGPLEVHLQVHEGQVQAQFVSAHPAVRQAVEAALPQLHDLFAGSGLSLMQTSVGAQGGQGNWQQRPGRSGSGGGLAALDPAAGTDATSAVSIPTSTNWQRGLVNTYV